MADQDIEKILKQASDIVASSESEYGPSVTAATNSAIYLLLRGILKELAILRQDLKSRA